MKNISHTLRSQFYDHTYSGLSYSLHKSLDIIPLATTRHNMNVLVGLHDKLMSNMYANIFVTLLDHQAIKSR